jgi:hypothetical protein
MYGDLQGLPERAFDEIASLIMPLIEAGYGQFGRLSEQGSRSPFCATGEERRISSSVWLWSAPVRIWGSGVRISSGVPFPCIFRAIHTAVHTAIFADAANAF